MYVDLEGKASWDVFSEILEKAQVCVVCVCVCDCACACACRACEVGFSIYRTCAIFYICFFLLYGANGVRVARQKWRRQQTSTELVEK